MPEMKWGNLKKNRCPQCNKDWLRMGNADFTNGMILCKCGFKISEKKMQLIISDKIAREILEEPDTGFQGDGGFTPY